MPQGVKEWGLPLCYAGLGIVAGLFCAMLVLMPLGQCLIDSDDDVVEWTIRYFKWAARAFCVACAAIGATVGFFAGRSLADADAPRQQGQGPGPDAEDSP
jgi:hypothetical protein